MSKTSKRTKTRKMGRMGMQKYRKKSRFNRPYSKFYNKPNTYKKKRLTQNAIKETSMLKKNLGLYLENHISRVPKHNKYKDLMQHIYKTDDKVVKKMLFKGSNPKNFRNIGKQVYKLTRKPLNIHRFINLMLIFWVLQDKLNKHGLKSA